MISIIIPFYNASAYLKRCIQSVLIQSHKDFELILVDDGSTDNSYKICKDFMDIDSRIVLISKVNEGAGKARNAGLKIAKGEYVGFVDSDDYIDVNMFSEMYTAALKNHADIVQCGFCKVDENGTILSKAKYRDIIISNNRLCFYEYCKKRNIDDYSPCKLFKRDILSGIYFGNYHYSEDAYFIVQAFMRCNKLVILSSNFYYYVQTSNSMCRRPFNKNFEDTIIVGSLLYSMIHQIYPGYSFYFARYTAKWIRYCYLGYLSLGYKKEISLLCRLKKKYDFYFAKSKIFFPINVESFLFILFRISPTLYNYLRNRKVL